MSNWVQGKVVENKRWTGPLYSLRIEANIDPFIAGQYGRLGLDIDGQIVGRPYSFVNTPDENIYEFYSVVVPGGPLSPRLVELHTGDPIWIDKRVNGFFTLSEVPDGKDIWMLATSTALGPFLSMLKFDEVWKRFENIALVHAVRYARELTYQDTLQKINEEYGGRFQFIPFVSREQTDFALSGRIPAAIENNALEDRANLAINPDYSQVMICGNPGMLADTRDALKGKGLKKNLRRSPGHITTESYW